MAIIDDQFKEANNHIRHVAQLMVTWYTFFITTNLVAIGWVAMADINKIINKSFILRNSINIIFLIANILGIMALVAIRKYFVIENLRIKEMILHIDKDGLLAECFRCSPVPGELYVRSIYLMISSLVAIAIAWICISII